MLHKAHSTEYFMPPSNLRPGAHPPSAPSLCGSQAPPLPRRSKPLVPPTLPTHGGDALPLRAESPSQSPAKMIRVKE